MLTAIYAHADLTCRAPLRVPALSLGLAWLAAIIDTADNAGRCTGAALGPITITAQLLLSAFCLGPASVAAAQNTLSSDERAPRQRTLAGVTRLLSGVQTAVVHGDLGGPSVSIPTVVGYSVQIMECNVKFAWLGGQVGG
jgi:hypothetical protein